MRFSCCSIIWVTLLTASTLFAEDTVDKSPITKKLQSLFQRANGERDNQPQAPSHPILIRVHEKAFAAAVGERIDNIQRVSSVILGTPISGTCRTCGKIQVNSRSGEDYAAFVVTFRGTANSPTIGVNGPARIYCHTVTNFTVSRQVTFSPQTGFQSEPTVVRAETRMTIDDIQSTRDGVLGRLVRRVAWRRAGDSHAQAERIAGGNMNRGLVRAFEEQLDQRVADLNERLQVARYVNSILGGPKKLDIKVNSSEDCVQLAVGRQGAMGEEIMFPADCPASPIEIWVHQSALSEPARALRDSLALVAGKATPAVAAMPMLCLLSWQPEEMTGLSMRWHDDWVVVSIDPAARQAVEVDALLARRANR